MRPSKMIKKIEKRYIAIGKERDKIDSMIDDLTDLRDCCDRAWDDLQHARDALSELV